MEQHPVPQNVTTFQFRLIGDMTLKQFGYLAAGAILAYISYKLPLPFFFTWPLAVIFAVGGFGFAFVPIEERPMDVWVLSFFKSIYSPTQYVWDKQAPAPLAPSASPPKADQSAAGPQGRRENILQGIFSPLNSQMDLTPPPAVRPKPQPSTVEETQKKEAAVDEKLQEVKHELEEKGTPAAVVTDLKKQLADLMAAHQKMEAELLALRKPTTPTSPPVSAHAAAAQAPPGASSVAIPGAPKPPTIQVISPENAVKAGLPRLTSIPNVVTGIVKDNEKNLLPGVLVTVKDRDGVPLRALKTNRIGQFAASTPLPNGVYFLEIEDPRLRFVFDRAQVTLNGSVVPAIEIFAKSQREITRAKLEKELFGKPT